MSADELESILARREAQTLELKESFDKECIETACAFANAGGGYLVIGVKDSGVLASAQLREESLRDYENRIATATEPVVVEWKEEPDGFATIYRERGDGSINGSINETSGTISGTINGTINGKINGKINEGEGCRNRQDSSDKLQIADFILPQETGGGKINGKINGTINGSINGSIKSELIGQLTHNEEKVLSIVEANPGCKRELIISKMTCSARTADRCIATLAAIGRLELRGSKKTGGYYLIEKP